VVYEQPTDNENNMVIYNTNNMYPLQHSVGYFDAVSLEKVIQHPIITNRQLCMVNWR
jgi:hypothetical protein